MVIRGDLTMGDIKRNQGTRFISFDVGMNQPPHRPGLQFQDYSLILQYSLLQYFVLHGTFK